jgi:hypothetical protein
MSGKLKKSDRKRLERIVLQARDRGAAAERKRMRQEREQDELDDDFERDEPHDDE